MGAFPAPLVPTSYDSRYSFRPLLACSPARKPWLGRLFSKSGWSPTGQRRCLRPSVCAAAPERRRKAGRAPKPEAAPKSPQALPSPQPASQQQQQQQQQQHQQQQQRASASPSGSAAAPAAAADLAAGAVIPGIPRAEHAEEAVELAGLAGLDVVGSEHDDEEESDSEELISVDLQKRGDAAQEAAAASGGAAGEAAVAEEPPLSKLTTGEPPKGSRVRNVMVAWCALVDTRNARVLLAQRNKGLRELRELYELPGGKVERGESPQMTVARELKEELGIKVDSSQLLPLGFVSQFYTVMRYNLVGLLFACDEWEGQPHGREGQQVRWVDSAGLAAFPMPPTTQPLVEQITRLLAQLEGRSHPSQPPPPPPQPQPPQSGDQQQPGATGEEGLQAAAPEPQQQPRRLDSNSSSAGEGLRLTAEAAPTAQRRQQTMRPRDQQSQQEYLPEDPQRQELQLERGWQQWQERGVRASSSGSSSAAGEVTRVLAGQEVPGVAGSASS